MGYAIRSGETNAMDDEGRTIMVRRVIAGIFNFIWKVLVLFLLIDIAGFELQICKNYEEAPRSYVMMLMDDIHAIAEKEDEDGQGNDIH